MRKNSYDIKIAVKNIIDFNSNLGENGPWGTYSVPFRSHQFMKLSESKSADQKEQSDIIDFPADSSISMTIEPSHPDYIEKFNFQIEYFRIKLIAPHEFTHSSPQELWKEIFDFSSIKGAVGASGDLYLSVSENKTTFKINTTENLNTLSYNLIYEVCFSFELHKIKKYCIIDPLIKTSSGHT